VVFSATEDGPVTATEVKATDGTASVIMTERDPFMVMRNFLMLAMRRAVWSDGTSVVETRPLETEAKGDCTDHAHDPVISPMVPSEYRAVAAYWAEPFS
jgi:hypothetical protein